MTSLSLPLLLLGAAFMAIELTNQVNGLNELHRLESKLAFHSLQKTLQGEIKEAENWTTPQDFKNKIKELSSFYNLDQIQIWDVLKGRPLFQNESLNSQDFTQAKIEETLQQKARGKTFYVLVNSQEKQLIAYIPLEGPEEKIYIARAVYSLANMQDALAKSKVSLFAILFFIIFAGAIIGRGLSKSIINPLKTLNRATREIIKGKLGEHANIYTGDEIQDLSETFNQMSDAMKLMKDQATDANPLTGLPGNNGIFSNLSKRIFERQKFVLFHTDLDRFKVFNDHYGLAKGDEAIKKTAELLRLAVKEKGSSDDFLGHQGGDDFVIITRPNRAKELAEYICDRFGKFVVPAVYSKEDVARGYTEHMDRRRFTETGVEVVMKFPLLAISLAGVSNAKRDFGDSVEVMALAVEVKKEVKKAVESSYLIQE